MQRECCWYPPPIGIRHVREFCHVYTINPISITVEEYEKIQKEVQGTITRPNATTFASPVMMDKHYIGVQNFVKGIKILK